MTLMKLSDAALRMMLDNYVSQRRTCRLVGVEPKAVRQERSPDSAEIRNEMREIASKRRRFDYGRIGILLERKSPSSLASAARIDPISRTTSPASTISAAC